MASTVYRLDVLKALGSAGAALVNEDEAVGAGQREQVGEKVSVVGAGAAVDDDQRGACAEGYVVDEDAVGVNETFLLGVDGGGGLGMGDGCGKSENGCQESCFHANHGNA